MSLPVLHSAAGYACSRLRRKPAEKRDWLLIATCIFMANAPDLDFIPGILINNADYFHRGASHSLAAALLAGAAGALILRYFFSRNFLSSFLVLTLAWTSHLFLDFFGSGGKGLALFYPFSTAEIYGPFMNPETLPCALESAGGFGSFMMALTGNGQKFMLECIYVVSAGGMIYLGRMTRPTPFFMSSLRRFTRIHSFLFWRRLRQIVAFSNVNPGFLRRV